MQPVQYVNSKYASFLKNDKGQMKIQIHFRNLPFSLQLFSFQLISPANGSLNYANETLGELMTTLRATARTKSQISIRPQLTNGDYNRFY